MVIKNEQLVEIKKLQQQLREQVMSGNQPDKKLRRRLDELMEETGFAEELGSDPDGAAPSGVKSAPGSPRPSGAAPEPE